MTPHDDSDNDTRHARMQLNRAATELDDMTVARLRALRKRAAAAAGARRSIRATWWLPLSTVAVSAVLVAALTLWWWPTPEPAAIAVATDDIEWLVAKDGPDLFSDLDFYSWLDDENDAG